MIKIVVDAMGGDNAPGEIVKGCVEALAQDKEIGLILTGDEAKIKEELAKYKKVDTSRLEIVHCTQTIEMNDVPTEAIRKKRDSSLVVAFKKLKEDEEVQGLVTAGSTGATLACGLFNLGRIRGVKRPALCPAIPNVHGKQTLLCDCGANAEVKPIMLLQFAVMASAYAKIALHVEDPKVALLNNGTEEHKGDPLRQETYQLLQKTKGIRFTGNAEGRDIMLGDADVVVADGFSGNIALKSMEGCGKLVLSVMKKEFKSSPFSLFGALCASGAIKRMKKQLDFDRYGGALLLGVKKVVIKSHGSSKAKAIVPSILMAAEAARKNLVSEIEKMLEAADLENLLPKEEA